MEEGVIAILGFWLCMIILVLRKPVIKMLEAKKVEGADTAKFEERCQKLEQTVSDVSGELIRVARELDEIRNSSEFSYKLLLQQQANLVAASTRAQADIQNAAIASGGTAEPKLLSSNAPQPEDFGKVTNEHTIRFERSLPGSKEQVWKYFTQSDLLGQWLAEGKIETQFGGQVALDFAPGRNPGNPENGARIKGLVSRAEEGKALCFSWEDEVNGVSSLLSLEFIEEGQKTKVILTHSRLPQERMHHFMACWHTFLDTLSARLRNLTPPDFNVRFREVIQVYLILVATVLAASPALAESPNATYKIVTSEKARLMSKYDNLWRDVDKTQREMDAMKRDTAPDNSTLNYLDKQLKDKYRDIKAVEYEIKDLDAALRG
jgi:uncharacterized protein YndB with AHSA1/START domain